MPSEALPDSRQAQSPSIRLYDNETQRQLGEITEAQLQFLLDHLEEESSDDQDYYLNRATLEVFAQAGADPALLSLLWQGLGEREDMEIRWTRL
jgi:processive 1,2-diacylglycerol beta-glucosyltransferase